MHGDELRIRQIASSSVLIPEGDRNNNTDAKGPWMGSGNVVAIDTISDEVCF